MATNQITQIYELKSLGTDQLLKEFDSVNKSVANLKKSVIDLKAELAKAGGNPEQMAKTTAALKNQEVQLANTTRRSKELNAELNAAKAMSQEAAESTGLLKMSYNELDGTMRTALEAQKEYSAAVEAGRKFEQEAAAAILTHKEAQDALDAEAAETIALVNQAQQAQEFYNSTLQEGAAASVAQEQRFVAASERLLLLRKEMDATVASMKQLEAAEAAGAISEEEMRVQGASLMEQQALLKQEISATTKELNLQAETELSTVGSIQEARAAVKQLTTERNSLNLSTQEGIERLQVLNATIDANNAFIKKNVDAYQQQKINIGNYPNLRAELQAVRLEMEKLFVAGQKDSAEFQQLSARAQQLTVSMAEVAAATKATAASAEANVAATAAASSGIAGIGVAATKSFGALRQLAYIIPGLGIAGIFSLLFEGFQKLYDKIANVQTVTKQAQRAMDNYKQSLQSIDDNANQAAGERIARLQILNSVVTDLTASETKRKEAANEMIKLYPTILGNYSQEAILAGKAAKSIDEITDALLANAAAKALEDKYGTATVNVINLRKQEKAATDALAKARLDAAKAGGTGKGGFAESEFGSDTSEQAALAAKVQEALNNLNKITTLRKEAEKEQKEYLNSAKEAIKTASDLLGGGEKPPPTVSATAAIKAEFKGAKELNDAIANLQQQTVEQFAQSDQEIYQNEQESLQVRLQAYQNYQTARALQAETTRDKEVANAKAELAAVDKLLNDQTQKRTQEETNSLIAQKAAANIKLEAAEQAYQAALATIHRRGVADLQGIVDSDIKVRLKSLDDLKAQAVQHAADENAANRDAYQKGQITFKQFKDKEKQIAADAQVYELNLIKKYLEAQIAAYQGPQYGLDSLKKALERVNAEIQSANTRALNNAQLTTADWKKFYKDLENAALDAARTIADGFAQEEDRKIEKTLQSQEKALDIEKQKRLDQAQTAEEKAAIELQFAKKQEDLERKAFEEHKKMAEKQLAIDFVIAAGKAAAAATGTGPAYLLSLLENEAVVALQYAAQLAILEKQQFAKSGLVMPQRLVGSGRVSVRPNIPAQSNGDNVLATVRTGEVILNEHHQRMAGGPAFFRALGVPGFAEGGYFGSQVQPPVFTSQIMRPIASAPDYSEKFDRLEGMIAGLYASISAESTKPVVLNPNAVTKSQDRTSKAVNVGTL
jgi:hypothetical protein